MFKIVAVLGLIAGGAGYATYEYTDLFGCDNSATCPLAKKAAGETAAQPSCCEPASDCCEPTAACCEAPSKVAAMAKAGCTDSCCSAKTTTVAAKVAACCDNPCVACALLACEACADCATCCGAASTPAAVAGVAAVVPAK